MQNEISQYDISSREMLAGRKAADARRYTDIGEARVISTMFGKAKVQVTCTADKKRRTWLLAILVATLLSAASWQVWIASQQTESFSPPIPLSARIRVSPPVHQPEYTPPVSAAKVKSGTQYLERNNLMPLPELPPPRPAGPANRAVTKPVATAAEIASKPEMEPSGNDDTIHADMQHSLSAPIHSAPPIVGGVPQENSQTVVTAPADQQTGKANSTPSPTNTDDSVHESATQPR